MTQSFDKNLHRTGRFLKVFLTFRFPFRLKVRFICKSVVEVEVFTQ